MFTRARHWYLPWARCIQSTTSHTISLWSILILSFHLCLDLPSGLFRSGFATKILFTSLLSPMCATWSAYLIHLDFITIVISGEGYKLWSSSRLPTETYEFNPITSQKPRKLGTALLCIPTALKWSLTQASLIRNMSETQRHLSANTN